MLVVLNIRNIYIYKHLMDSMSDSVPKTPVLADGRGLLTLTELSLDIRCNVIFANEKILYREFAKNFIIFLNEYFARNPIDRYRAFPTSIYIYLRSGGYLSVCLCLPYLNYAAKLRATLHKLICTSTKTAP